MNTRCCMPVSPYFASFLTVTISCRVTITAWLSAKWKPLNTEQNLTTAIVVNKINKSRLCYHCRYVMQVQLIRKVIITVTRGSLFSISHQLAVEQLFDTPTFWVTCPTFEKF